MTTNQTIDGVPRADIEAACKADASRGATALELVAGWAAMERLRAVLDAPHVNTDVRTILLDITPGFDGMGHEVYARSVEDVEDALSKQGERIEELEMELHRIKADQPRCEPVAYRYREGHASWENENPWVPTTLGHGEVLIGRKELAANGTFKGEERDHYLALVVEPLYAEQPAPVAVAGNRTPFEIEHDAEPGEEAAFRQWRQERLNTARPAHANPPPGTEPCGTHHDNDGLDEMRKP